MTRLWRAPDNERCVDQSHVVEWAMKTLDVVRREIWRQAYSEAIQLAKEHPKDRGSRRDRGRQG